MTARELVLETRLQPDLTFRLGVRAIEMIQAAAMAEDGAR